MHRILNQTVELSIVRHADAVMVQDRISRECQGGGLLELGRVFDRLAGDKVIRVGRMELDLGEIAGDDWLAEFLQRLAECAESTLVQATAGSVAGSMSSAGDGQVGFAESLSERSQAQERFEALATLLRSGRLPWWSDLVVEESWVRGECAMLTTADKRSLIGLAAGHPRALQRLVIHLRAQEVGQLLGDSLPPSLAGRLATAIERLESHLGLPSMRISEWRAAYWRPFFGFVQAGPAKLEPESVVRGWFSSLEELLPRSVEKLQGRLDTSASALGLPGEWQQAFGKMLRRATADRLRIGRRAEQAPELTGGEKPPGAGSTQAPTSADRRAEQAPEPAGGEKPPAAGPAEAPASAGRGAPGGPPAGGGIARQLAEDSFSLAEPDDFAVEELYVTGAGMVLLHPFLGELFTHLGLVDEGQFVDEDARHVAVHVLGYMAFGSEERVEAELTLAKLLCGMALDEVLLPVNLSAAAFEKADELLAAVLKHWATLKTSSVQWLREQFILRTGKLRQVDAGWKLVVESRAQDVLIPKLPWGFGVISLPWLDTMLHVSWGD